MVGIIRRLFGRALKTNENLSFAVLTGLSLLRAEPDALPPGFLDQHQRQRVRKRWHRLRKKDMRRDSGRTTWRRF